MSCTRYEEALTAAALGAGSDRGLVQHLSECSSCRTKLDEARLAVVAMDRDLQTLLSVTPAPDFTVRVTTRALEAPRPHAWIHWAAAAATCAAIVVAAIGVRGLLDRASPVTPMRVSGSSGPVASPPRAEAPVEVTADAPGRALAETPVRALERAIRRRQVRTSRAAMAPPDVTREVVVQPEQVRAVRRFVVAVAEGRFALEELPRTADASLIVPMTVQPIPVREIEVRDASATARPVVQGGE